MRAKVSESGSSSLSSPGTARKASSPIHLRKSVTRKQRQWARDTSAIPHRKGKGRRVRKVNSSSYTKSHNMVIRHEVCLQWLDVERKLTSFLQVFCTHTLW